MHCRIGRATVACGLVWGSVVMATAAAGPLLPVPFTQVTIADEFWAPRLQTTRARTLPHNFKLCEETGRINNFVRAAGTMEGPFEGYFFNDSDVYKVLEGAAYALATERDPELERYVDELIAKIGAAQQPDGYLNTYFTLTKTEPRWTNLRVRHELYCAGHLIEAAVAHHQATGKRTLLDVALKLADHIDSIFGPDKRSDVCGHEEIELALIKLAGLTGEDRYFKLAEFFLEQRGRPIGRELYGDYCQDHAPIRAHTQIVGHAVRAMYLYSAVADVAARTGDPGLLTVLERVWTDLVETKMYLTGGIGPSSHNEGFTQAYDLPSDTAYAETCAAIGLVLWSHRLNLLHADARYVDVLERTLYNGLLSGVSLNGEKFFYVNPLGSSGDHHRQPWYDCACCPSNVVRFLPAVGSYVYAHNDEAIYVNLFVAGRGTIPLGDGKVSLTQQTRYPWDGYVKLTVEPAAAATFTLHLRVPGWCAGAQLSLNGQPVNPLEMDKGYAKLTRSWQSGDVVELTLPMPVRRIEAHPNVATNRGRVALQRGPLVYCLEGVDNDGQVRNLVLPRDARLTTEHRGGLLGGIIVIHGTAWAVTPPDWDGQLYRPTADVTPVEFSAIPYYAWDNREPGEMVVWLPESPALFDPPPAPGIKPSASHCWDSDNVAALHDRREPADSNDQRVPRFTWWPRRGSREWVRYDFDEPRRVSHVAVYWFDDERSGGGCRRPAAWRLLYRDGQEWREAPHASAYGVELDRYNLVSFDPVETVALKIEAELRPDCSGGILEWKVGQR